MKKQSCDFLIGAFKIESNASDEMRAFPDFEYEEAVRNTIDNIEMIPTRNDG